MLKLKVSKFSLHTNNFPSNSFTSINKDAILVSTDKTSLRVITIFQKIFQTTLPKSYKLPKIHVVKNNYYNHIKKNNHNNTWIYIKI